MHAPGNFERLAHLYGEGERLVAQGRLEEAVARFGEALAIDDHFRQRYVTLYAQRAFALHRLERYAEAIDDYGRAIAMEPPAHQAQYHMQRAMCLRQLGRDDEAYADFTRSATLAPDQPGPWHLRGRLNVDHERWQEAIGDFDRLLALRPHPNGYQQRAFAKMNQKDYAGALPDALTSLQMQADPYTDYLAAGCLAVLGQTEPMLEHAARAAAADPYYRQALAEDEEFARYRGWAPFEALLAALRAFGDFEPQRAMGVNERDADG
jgi:tetratricopeptide (TPR) repeat protein